MTFPRHYRLLLTAAWGLSGATASHAETDHDDPATELASFKLPEGFQAELFASEKDGVVKPIQIRWDALGRLWVIGSETYPQIKPGEAPNDKVLILEDPSHTGHLEKVTVFADGLSIPTGLEIDGDGRGCYVGEGTKLWHFRDDEGSGHATRREVVLRGFGTGDNHQNLNSFLWSPGGDLMFCQGLHSFARVETPWGISRLDQAGLWRLNLKSLRLEGYWGSAAEPQNPWGWVFTDWGEPLVVAGNNGGIYYPVPEFAHGGDDRRSGNCWVNPRGRKSSGPDIVETAHLPAEWQGVMIDGGYISNAVWALKIEDDGAGFRCTDLPPLVTSSHGSFRPVDTKIGPDGAIYLADWYNPIIGHYQASFRDPNRDKTHGRIWRITYPSRPLVQQPTLVTAETEALCEALKSPERWTRFQAKRVLASRGAATTAAPLRAWCDRQDPSDPGTAHALVEAAGVFQALGAPDGRVTERLLHAREAGARAYAARALAHSALEGVGVAAALVDLANDEDARVRLSAIVAAGNIPSAESVVAILSAAEHPRDRFLNTALHNSVLALKPQWTPLLAKAETLGWKEQWVAFLRKNGDAQMPVRFGEAADAKTLALVKTAADSGTATTRVPPELIARLAADAAAHGDAGRGDAVFHRAEVACTACHSVGGKGGNIGPPLDTIGSAQPLEFIVGAVLDPQREVKEGYEAVEVATNDGKIVQGYILRDDDKELALRDISENREERFPKTQIARRRDIGSLMPAGLLDRLSHQDRSDLFAYLSQLGKPQR